MIIRAKAINELADTIVIDKDGRDYNQRLSESKKCFGQTNNSIVVKTFLMIEWMELFLEYGPNPKISPEALQKSDELLPPLFKKYFQVISDPNVSHVEKIKAGYEAKKSINLGEKWRQSAAKTAKVEKVLKAHKTELLRSLEMLMLVETQNAVWMSTKFDREREKGSPLTRSDYQTIGRMFGDTRWHLDNCALKAASNELKVDCDGDLVDFDHAKNILGNAVTPSTQAAALFRTGNLTTKLLYLYPFPTATNARASTNPTSDDKGNSGSKRKPARTATKKNGKRQKTASEGLEVGNDEEMSEAGAATIVTSTSNDTKVLTPSEQREYVGSCLRKSFRLVPTEEELDEFIQSLSKEIELPVKKRKTIFQDDDDEEVESISNQGMSDNNEGLADTDDQENVDGSSAKQNSGKEDSNDDNDASDDSVSSGERKTVHDVDDLETNNEEIEGNPEEEERGIEDVEKKLFPGLTRGCTKSGSLHDALKAAYKKLESKTRVSKQENLLLGNVANAADDNDRTEKMKIAANDLDVSIMIYSGQAGNDTEWTVRDRMNKNKKRVLNIVGLTKGEEVQNNNNTTYHYYYGETSDK